MTKRKNIGLTMVEILISLAIFMILMLPIVQAIITSLHNTTSAKELQYRNEFAENLMEHVKSVAAGEIEDDSYYTSNGSTNVKVGTDASGTGNYKVDGTVELGTEKTQYAYHIEVSSEYYDNKTINTQTFTFNPNDIALGKIENLDYRNVAYIDGTVLNNDYSVEQYFKLEKLTSMKTVDPVGYKQQMEGDADILKSDSGVRLTTVEVSGNKKDGYRVRCIMSYCDSNTKYLTDNYKEVTAFDQTYTGSLPNIYLTYNPCFYNNGYAKNDYVAIDLTNMNDASADMPDVNFYLVEISEQMSENLINSQATDADGNVITDKVTGSTIYNSNTRNGVKRDDVNIHLVGATSDGSTDKLQSKLHVYHNIGENTETYEVTNADGTTEEVTKDKNNKKSDISQLKHTSSDGAIDDTLNSFVSFKKTTKDVNGKDYSVSYVLLDDSVLKTVDEDETKARSLYQVKIWLQEGTTVDTTQDPVLQGTKGGSGS